MSRSEIFAYVFGGFTNDPNRVENRADDNRALRKGLEIHPQGIGADIGDRRQNIGNARLVVPGH